ncbi:MAG: aquaporin, partial [Acidimicrobiales bacterium]
MSARKLFAECLGTALLVFIAVGVATLSFGKWASGPLIAGSTGTSVAAGVVATALAFGLVLLILAYA